MPNPWLTNKKINKKPIEKTKIEIRKLFNKETSTYQYELVGKEKISLYDCIEKILFYILSFDNE